MASAMVSSLNDETDVTIGWRLAGGVLSELRSRAPMSENWSVRGMGVADIVSVSTLTLSCLSRSLTATPNFCSSSTTSRPKSLNFTSLPIILWVPMSMSILPSARSATIFLTSFGLRAREMKSTLTGSSLRRSEKVR